MDTAENHANGINRYHQSPGYSAENQYHGGSETFAPALQGNDTGFNWSAGGALSASAYLEKHFGSVWVDGQLQRAVPIDGVKAEILSWQGEKISLRVASALTNLPHPYVEPRRLVVKFEGHYHGWVDGALLSYHPSAAELERTAPPCAVLGSKGQVPNAAENVLIAPWNDAEALARLFAAHGSEIAAVIGEPVVCNSGCLFPEPGYLEAVARIAKQNGSLLIFDEVITGFRIGLGGAQKLFGITPDLATFGKAIGGGLPLSAICGRREIMELMFGGGVSFGGTFNGNPLSLAGAAATIDELSKDGGQPLATACQTGESLIAGIRAAAARRSVPLLVTGFGAAFALHFTAATRLRNYRDTLADDRALLDRFLLAAATEGINPVPDGRMYVSTVHSPRDVAETVAAFDRAFESLGFAARTGL